MTIEQLGALKAQYDAEITSRSKGASSGKVAKPKRAGSERGTAWASFTKKVIEEHASEFAAFKEAAEVKQGVAPKFVADYRKSHLAEWESYSVQWKLEHPATSESASVASADEAVVPAEPATKAPKPKKVSKPKEAKEPTEAKAKKEPKAKKVATAEVAAKAAAPVALALPPAPTVAPVAESAASSDSEEVELMPFTLDGQTYMRPKSGAEWASGDLWYTDASGGKGNYLGELMEDGSINTDAEEPSFE